MQSGFTASEVVKQYKICLSDIYFRILSPANKGGTASPYGNTVPPHDCPLICLQTL